MILQSQNYLFMACLSRSVALLGGSFVFTLMESCLVIVLLFLFSLDHVCGLSLMVDSLGFVYQEWPHFYSFKKSDYARSRTSH